MEWVKEFISWAPTAPLFIRLFLLVVIVASTGWYLLSYKPPAKRINISNERLSARLELIDIISIDYFKLEKGIWQAKQHLSENEMTKNEIVEYIRPLTKKASDIRTRNRTRFVELGSLMDLTRALDLSILLCFSQLIIEVMPEDQLVHTEPIEVPSLEETIDEIGNRIQHLSFSKSVYHKIIDRGVNSLSEGEYDMFLWLIGEGMPSNKANTADAKSRAAD